MAEVSGWDVQEKGDVSIPAKFQHWKPTGRSSYHRAAWDHRVVIDEPQHRLVKEDWEVTKTIHKNGVASVEYKTPDREPFEYEIMFDEKGRRFSFNQRFANGSEGVALTLREDGTVDFGPYTPRKIEGAGLYWDAHNFRDSFESFLKFASDPNFNGPLPKLALPQLCDALKQGKLKWQKEIENVGPRGDVGLQAGQWDTYKRLSYAGFPEKA